MSLFTLILRDQSMEDTAKRSVSITGRSLAEPMLKAQVSSPRCGSVVGALSSTPKWWRFDA